MGVWIVSVETLIRTGWVQPYVLPPPLEVIDTLVLDRAEYFNAAIDTLAAAFLGLALSAVLGVGVALMLSSSKWLERSLYPYAVFFQTVPIISIAPLLVIWFGYGFSTVVVSALIVSIFPIIANTVAGFRSALKPLVELFRLYQASRWVTLRKLLLPSAVPYILTGIRISTGLALIGAVVGEFIAGGGLGGLIDTARTQQRLDKVFAAIMLTSLAGVLCVALLNAVSRVLLRNWR
jgi:NitT/TauT family transport system permease protein